MGYVRPVWMPFLWSQSFHLNWAVPCNQEIFSYLQTGVAALLGFRQHGLPFLAGAFNTFQLRCCFCWLCEVRDKSKDLRIRKISKMVNILNSQRGWWRENRKLIFHGSHLWGHNIWSVSFNLYSARPNCYPMVIWHSYWTWHIYGWFT